MFNAATLPESVHLLLGSIMVTGFIVSSVYAVALLRGRRDRYHRLGFAIPFLFAAVTTPLQIGAGDMAARYVADRQPVKLAALEGQLHTEQGAGEHIGGLVINGKLQGAIVIPHGLALLAFGDPNATVRGLDSVPVDQQPPTNVVHTAFDLMVGVGFGLLTLGAWLAWTWRRTKALPTSPWFFRAAILAGPAAAAAMEAGWVVTEVGRQPWAVYGVLRTDHAVSTAPGLFLGFYVLLAVYAVLTVSTAYVLRRMARSSIVPSAVSMVGASAVVSS
jgi:cytochrome d ubiquinol oxidase subunit I